MPLYVADYLGDTRLLTTEQHGAYLLLLMAMWRTDGVLPDDDAKLARIAGLTTARWRKIGGDVLAFFTPCAGGLTQARLSVELTISNEKSEKNSQSGRMGGRAKALKDKKSSLANATETPWPPEPTQIPIEGSEDKSSGANRAVPVDHDAAAWFQAVKVLTAQGRMTEAKARPLFGRLVSANKLQPRDLLPSLAAATVSGTLDPQGYLTKAAEAVARRRVEDAKPKRVSWV